VGWGLPCCTRSGSHEVTLTWCFVHMYMLLFLLGVPVPFWDDVSEVDRGVAGSLACCPLGVKNSIITVGSALYIT
jgi:hypothetical protein